MGGILIGGAGSNLFDCRGLNREFDPPSAAANAGFAAPAVYAGSNPVIREQTSLVIDALSMISLPLWQLLE